MAQSAETNVLPGCFDVQLERTIKVAIKLKSRGFRIQSLQYVMVRTALASEPF